MKRDATIVWVRLEFTGADAEDSAADVVNGLLDVGSFQDAIGEAVSGAGYDIKLTSALEVNPGELLETVTCAGCEKILPLVDSYSPGDEALCADCDTEVTGRQHPNNDDRAHFARVGLEAYAAGVGDSGEDFETQASDLLGDLLHLCDAEGQDFEALLQRARAHYVEEVP